MVTALTHHPSTKMSGKDKRINNSIETQERVPKRKLLRSNTSSEPFKLYRLTLHTITLSLSKE